MPESRALACSVCGTTTDSEGRTMASVSMPDGTSEEQWAAVLAHKAITCEAHTVPGPANIVLTQEMWDALPQSIRDAFSQFGG